MGEHWPSVHGKKASEHSDSSPLWEECMLQTYFTSPGRIDYFVVVDNKTEENLNNVVYGEPSDMGNRAIFLASLRATE
jgi:hypothetical protein